MNHLPWRPGADKVAVLIGDRPPHGAGLDGFAGCPCGVDYRDELELLVAGGVRVHATPVGRCLAAHRVFEYAAARTGGVFTSGVHVRRLAGVVGG